jgi:MFS family permease|tara:strand:+ start:4001 stop:5245 length:1245 start_codon:yes stop_codon:yes gene_type:complete
VPTQYFSFGHYLATIGTSNFGLGLFALIYPWLIVGVLQESPSRLGMAQMALLLPNLLFILPGGVVSDRSHRGSWLSLLYLLYLVPVGVLAGAILTNQLSFLVLIVCGMAFGTVSAFVQPTRESLLGYAAPNLMHQAVAKVVMVQFIAQGIGFAAAGQLESIGLTFLLALQMAAFVASSLLIRQSHPRPLERDKETLKPRQPLTELREGVQLFFETKALLHLVVLTFATGALAFGVYLVGMPLIAKQAYGGGAQLYAAMQVTFTLGVVSANFGVMKRAKMFNRPGRLIIITFLWRGGLVGVVALLPSFWVLFPTLFAWGFFSGLSMTLGRTLLHNQVPHELRSRASSVYQLCLFGGAPLGAWGCGFSIEAIGLSYTFMGITCLTLIVSVAAFFSPLWALVGRQDDRQGLVGGKSN